MSSAGGGRRRARSTRARPSDEQLLDAALEVFARRGFAATTMNLIAEQCDSTKPTLYAHFGDKDTLFARLLERESATCRAMLFEAYADSAPLGLREQVAADTEAFFAYAAAHPDGFALLLGGDLTVAAVRVREELLADVTEHIAQRVHDYLEVRGADVSPRGPGPTERQIAAMVAGLTVSAARHALAGETPYQESCDLAIAFSTGALASLDPT